MWKRLVLWGGAVMASASTYPLSDPGIQESGYNPGVFAAGGPLDHHQMLSDQLSLYAGESPDSEGLALRYGLHSYYRSGRQGLSIPLTVSWHGLSLDVAPELRTQAQDMEGEHASGLGDCWTSLRYRTLEDGVEKSLGLQVKLPAAEHFTAKGPSLGSGVYDLGLQAHVARLFGAHKIGMAGTYARSQRQDVVITYPNGKQVERRLQEGDYLALSLFHRLPLGKRLSLQNEVLYQRQDEGQLQYGYGESMALAAEGRLAFAPLLTYSKGHHRYSWGGRIPVVVDFAAEWKPRLFVHYDYTFQELLP